MKKLIKFITLVGLFYFFLGVLTVNTHAASQNINYITFVEIMMPSGKLVKNYTKEEIEELKAKGNSPKLMGVNIVPYSDKVNSTYISDTIYSLSNDSNTDITYDLSTKLESELKASLNMSGSQTASADITYKIVKAALTQKFGLDFSSSIKISREEKESMKVIIEAHSKCLVYLTGEIQVSNGYVAFYTLFCKTGESVYEVAIIQNQYARIEKVAI